MPRIERANIGKENPFAPKNRAATKRTIKRYAELGSQVREMLRPDVSEATVEISGLQGAMRILVVSDLHAFSEAVDLGTIDSIWREIDQPDTFVLFAGDLIDGIRQEYLGQVTSVHLPMQEQIDSFRELWLEPLARKGKILGMVSRFGSHDDWPADKTTINAVSLLLSGLTMPDGSAIPLIYNGGRLKLHFTETDLTFAIKLNHMVSGSGSTLNPVKPLRDQIVIEKLPRNTTIPVAAVAGHNHTRAGVSSERVMAGANEVQLVLLQNGSIKGVDPRQPDFFLQKRGLATAPKLAGAAMILRINEKPGRKNELQVVPTYGSTRSRFLLEAMNVLDRTESQGITSELMGRIAARNGPMTVKLEKDSRTTERIAESAIRSPLYKELDWRIDTGRLDLPLTVYTISHARFGSSEIYLDHMRSILTEVERSPLSALLVLGDMVDLSVPGKSNRGATLETFAKEIARVPSERRLGIMLSSVFRSDRWNKEVKEGGEVVSEPVLTGDWLYYKSAVKNTPLYEGGASMRVSMGKVDYWWFMLDGTGNFGSRQDPYLALIQMDKLSMVNNDVVTGGISTIPGALTNSKILLSPGWESPAVDRRYGKAFSQRVPKGGQGVVMFPDMVGNDKVIFGGASFRETRDCSQALTLWRGLDRMGELDKVVKRKQVKKR